MLLDQTGQSEAVYAHGLIVYLVNLFKAHECCNGRMAYRCTGESSTESSVAGTARTSHPDIHIQCWCSSQHLCLRMENRAASLGGQAFPCDGI